MSKYLVINSLDHKGPRCNVSITNTYGDSDWLFTPYYPEETKVEGRATIKSLNPYHLYKGKKFGLIQMNTAEHIQKLLKENVILIHIKKTIQPIKIYQT